MQVMKRKIQHNAVNNQEDEDSCTYPICFSNEATGNESARHSGPFLVGYRQRKIKSTPLSFQTLNPGSAIMRLDDLPAEK